MYSVGIDVGGTHTDLVVLDQKTGQLHVNKAPTSVDDPSRGAINALVALCADAEISPNTIDHFMHGTTVATNIALEHNGARTGLITTEGFRDILHIARHKRPQTFSLQLDLPWQRNPLVPRRWRMTVPERIIPPGEILRTLDEDAVRIAVEFLLSEGVEAIAVCFLHSYLNSAHEARTVEIIQEMAPDLFVCASYVVVPQYREYERFSTTALNAYIGPKTARYLRSMDQELKTQGVGADLHLMQSSGGAATLQAAEARPVNLLMSGPAGGLIGGIWVGKSARYDSVITLDVGGTSADIGVAPNGEILYKHILDTRLGDYHAMVPMAELDTIGAGGGSIAYVDSGGQFQVGPRSAGADPGPSCYGTGGTEPTATDCMLALGWIDPDNFLGGRTKLHPEMARKAIQDNLCGPLGMSVEAAASGAIRILTHSMIQACEINSVRRGYDPRDFALVAFGGAGPLFACEIAREMNIPAVIIPPTPGLTSALGLLASDVTYEQSRTVMASSANPETELLEADFAKLEVVILGQLRDDGFQDADIEITRQVDCRYAGQGYELRSDAPEGPVDAAYLEAIRAGFDAAHLRQYGKDFPEKQVQIVNIRIQGRGRTVPLQATTSVMADDADPINAKTGSRLAYYLQEGEPIGLQTPSFDRLKLHPGHKLIGPAIVDQMDTTTVIPPGFGGVVDASGNIVLKPRAEVCHETFGN